MKTFKLSTRNVMPSLGRNENLTANAVRFLLRSSLGIIIIAGAILIPQIASANFLDGDAFLLASLFAQDFSLWISIVIGVTASIMVFRSAKRMGGGLFEQVLNYFGLGMLLVVIGFIFTALSAWIPKDMVTWAHTIFFSIGYINMVLGANKLMKGIYENGK